ncbi:hypothetical protein [Yoonia sp. SS1-5]|uniref:TFIIB-type zinc ribbon-containing protein n=1 Tax=Yoonia rhodophyticola TaxID=3137370 RepID=A0AAN0NLF6_9RHOB
MAATKIATCCYCGTRAALVLRGKERHELTCSNCGAPLHALKMLPIAPHGAPAADHAKRTKAHRPPARHYPAQSYRKPQKRKKSKSFRRKVFEELWDVIEDVFD